MPIAATICSLRSRPKGWCAGSSRFPFLTAAAVRRGQPIVFERLASDAAVPARTVREYFQVLEDTLLGTLLRPFSPREPRRKPMSHAKLYFFDVGVANVLAGITHVEAGSPTFGLALEQLVFCELRAWLAYTATTGRSPFGARRMAPRWTSSSGTRRPSR